MSIIYSRLYVRMTGLSILYIDDLMCPFGKILQLCYKECIPECNDGYQCPVGCEPNDECNECASGCICPDGKSIFGDICLPSEECPDIDAGTYTYNYVYVYVCKKLC